MDADMVRLADDGGGSSDGDGGGSDSDAMDADLDVGDEIEARYGGKKAWYKGTIMRKRSDGTFDIEYADGDKESRVKPELVRRVGATKPKGRSRSASRSGAKSIKKGSKVEARYRGRSKWLGGSVTRVNVNGTFDIRYDDGKRETGVDADMVRLADSNSNDGSDSDAVNVDLDVGDEIEARYGGKSAWYKGTIMRKRSDGTFDIEYDDGDKESRVTPELVRRVGATSSTKGRSRSASRAGAKSIKKGSKIEARYRGRSKWVGGSVSRVNVNGTFDVRYDDGKRETGVDADMVRLADGGDSNDDRSVSDGGSVNLDVGDEIEARYGGKQAWYKGTIMRKRSDGTFDIEYDDGDKETRVKPELVRRVGASSTCLLYTSPSPRDRG